MIYLVNLVNHVKFMN